MQKMPDKPDTWALLMVLLSQYGPNIYAAGLSVAMAWLRVIYGGGKARQALLEGAICGGLTLTIISGLEFFGLPSGFATFVGGWVGFLGVDKIRLYADRYANFKLPTRGAD